MPLGFLIEDGPHSEFAELYGAHQLDTADYRARTAANAKTADGTLWFSTPHTPGYPCSSTAAWPKPMRAATDNGVGPPALPSQIAQWIRFNKIRVLIVAGNRESKAPGIGLRVEAFLGRVFAITRRAADVER
jgi:hypothetical protein